MGAREKRRNRKRKGRQKQERINRKRKIFGMLPSSPSGPAQPSPSSLGVCRHHSSRSVRGGGGQPPLPTPSHHDTQSHGAETGHGHTAEPARLTHASHTPQWCPGIATSVMDRMPRPLYGSNDPLKDSHGALFEQA